MKNKKYNQVQILKTCLTQKKWWLNSRLEKLWVTTQLNTRALVLHIFNNRYILLDKHYNQLNVHKFRIRESYEEAIKKHNKLCEFINEITPKPKKRKCKDTLVNNIPSYGFEPFSVQIPTNWRSDNFYFGDLADDINE